MCWYEHTPQQYIFPNDLAFQDTMIRKISSK